MKTIHESIVCLQLATFAYSFTKMAIKIKKWKIDSNYESKCVKTDSRSLKNDFLLSLSLFAHPPSLFFALPHSLSLLFVIKLFTASVNAIYKREREGKKNVTNAVRKNNTAAIRRKRNELHSSSKLVNYLSRDNWASRKKTCWFHNFSPYFCSCHNK